MMLRLYNNNIKNRLRYHKGSISLLVKVLKSTDGKVLTCHYKYNLVAQDLIKNLFWPYFV